MRRSAGALLAALCIGLLTLCLAGGAVFGLAQVWLPHANWPIGYTALACLNAEARPRWRVGVAWILPQINSISAWSSLRGRCFWTPWLPFLPESGRAALP